MVKVSCILCHQLRLAYNLARPAIHVAGKGGGGMFLFLLFLHFHSCFSFFSFPLFHLLYYLFYLFSPFLWEMTQNDPQGLTCRLAPTQSINHLIYLSSHTATPPCEDYVQVIARREEKKKESVVRIKVQ